MSSRKRVIILGARGNAIDVLETLQSINETSASPRYECAGFLDDAPSRQGTLVQGHRVLGPLERARDFPDCVFINAIGSPANFWLKPGIIGRTGLPHDRFETVVHPSASVSRSAVLGQGTVVLQNATVASNVTAGRHVMILPNAVLSHDDVIGEYTCVATSATVSGDVRVGPSCYLGANCGIRGGLRIGRNCLVGLGAAVVSDLPENGVYVGVPARFARKLLPEGGADAGASDRC